MHGSCQKQDHILLYRSAKYTKRIQKMLGGKFGVLGDDLGNIRILEIGKEFKNWGECKDIGTMMKQTLICLATWTNNIQLLCQRITLSQISTEIEGKGAAWP